MLDGICEELKRFSEKHEGIKAIYTEQDSVNGGMIYHFFVDSPVDNFPVDVKDLFKLQMDLSKKDRFFTISILRSPPLDFRDISENPKRYGFLEECVYAKD